MMTDKFPPQPSSPVARSRTFTPYVLAWAALALVSLVYLGFLVTQPTVVASYLGTADSREDATASAAEKAAVEATAEVRSLRDTVDLFRNELIEMRAQITSQTDSARELATRIAVLEAPPADTQKVAAKDAKGAAKSKDAAKPAQTAAAAPAQKTAKEAATKKALETGSVAQPSAAEAITFGPPTITTTIAVPPSDAGRQVGVQIATGPSVDSLRLSWTLLNERHGGSLGQFQPRYTTDVSGSEQAYDLVVGPVASVDDARRLCQELALKGTPCSVTRFTGDAL